MERVDPASQTRAIALPLFSGTKPPFAPTIPFLPPRSGLPRRMSGHGSVLGVQTGQFSDHSTNGIQGGVGIVFNAGAFFGCCLVGQVCSRSRSMESKHNRIRKSCRDRRFTNAIIYPTPDRGKWSHVIALSPTEGEVPFPAQMRCSWK